MRVSRLAPENNTGARARIATNSSPSPNKQIHAPISAPRTRSFALALQHFAADGHHATQDGGDTSSSKTQEVARRDDSREGDVADEDASSLSSFDSGLATGLEEEGEGEGEGDIEDAIAPASTSIPASAAAAGAAKLHGQATRKRKGDALDAAMPATRSRARRARTVKTEAEHLGHSLSADNPASPPAAPITTTTTATTTTSPSSKARVSQRRKEAKQALPRPQPQKRPRRARRGTQAEIDVAAGEVKIHGPPPRWREVYDTVKAMRARMPPAPVDTMGCERLAEEGASPRTRRFQTLLSLMLSSQTKDSATAQAMRRLQTELASSSPPGGGLTLEAILALPPAQLNAYIQPVGFHNVKTRHIKATAEILAERHGGDIPDSVDGLLALPGVGPKMAYLAMAAAWGRPEEGIGVDVHVWRITNLWGWGDGSGPGLGSGSRSGSGAGRGQGQGHGPAEGVEGEGEGEVGAAQKVRGTKSPEETRKALQSWLPRELWHEINTLLVGFGQTVCLPVGRRCDECDVGAKGLCPSMVVGQKTRRRRRRERTEKEEEEVVAKGERAETETEMAKREDRDEVDIEDFGMVR